MPGYYARSTDYMDIVQNNRRGLWNVPYISTCYLLKGKLIHDETTKPSIGQFSTDPDMQFCQSLREKDIFMYVSNRVEFGHLVKSDDFDTSHLHNDMYEMISNRYDWEKR